MFCPVCRDEYRPGFTRCEACDADLVEAPDTAAPRKAAPIVTEVAAEEATSNFCGFLTLDEARHARDKVRDAKLTAEILIRDAPGTAAAASAQEEYWLRVRPRDFRAIIALIGFEPAETEDADAVFGCSVCGATVHGSDEACPGCGLRFEE